MNAEHLFMFIFGLVVGFLIGGRFGLWVASEPKVRP